MTGRSRISVGLTSVPVASFQTYRYTRFAIAAPPGVAASVRYRKTAGGFSVLIAIPSSPRSLTAFTATVSTGAGKSVPPTTRRTEPVDFSSTRKSSAPRNASVVGWLSDPGARTCSTTSSGSLTVCAFTVAARVRTTSATMRIVMQ